MYRKIYNIDNLYLASKKAQKGKKSKVATAKFWLYEDREILQMHEELRDKNYKWGGYNSFIFNDKGVERRISVAPFRDRVLHHAIMNQIEPLFEKSFIFDSYANRKGKGTSNALKRANYFAKKYKFVLQLDIKKFFPSIDHEILINQLSKKIECEDTMTLLEDLIINSNRQDDAYFYFKSDNLFTPFERKKGIPLGNLTSQFFGNLYLSRFDHFVKEFLRVKGYIRYVDDTLYFSNSKEFLLECIEKIKDFLQEYRLRIHPLKIKLLESENGFIYLGHKVFKTHFRLTSKAIRRGRKNLKKIKYEYRYGKIEINEAKNRIFGSVGFFKIGKNYNMVDELLLQTTLYRL